MASVCGICGEVLPPGGRTCSVCGTAVAEERLPTAEIVAVVANGEATPMAAILPDALPEGSRYCPSCGKTYDSDFLDTYCFCGVELSDHLPEAPPAPLPPAAATAPVPAAETSEPLMKVRADKQPPGTKCLVLFGPDKQPLHYFELTKDATLIGRLDAVAGVFPDIDLEEWLDRAFVRTISRQHALVLRSRASDVFSLRPLAGNTGTQLEADMLLPLKDYPLKPGHRVILGGSVRMKFEIV
jgi:hypothetical protein